MGIRELRAKYGKNLKGRQAVNAAIRAEVVGGDDCLDSLATVTRLADRLDERQLAGRDLAKDAHRSLAALREVMAGVISERYELSR